MLRLVLPRDGEEPRRLGRRADRAPGSVLTYTGASQVVSPKAEILAKGALTGEEIGVAEIDPAAARDKSINEFNDLFANRRPELYLRLGERDG